jgi:NADP-dependent 3-hydroxy acid dehydrogenase YdfG
VPRRETARNSKYSSRRLRLLRRYKVEVTDAAAIDRNMQDVVRDFGKLDCFVANAGMAISKPITETSTEEYRTQMAVNGVHLSSRDHGRVPQLNF